MSAFDQRRLQEASAELQVLSQKLNAITSNVVVEKKQPVKKVALIIHMDPAFGDPYDEIVIVDKGLEEEYIKYFSDHCTDWDGYEQCDSVYVPREYNS